MKKDGHSIPADAMVRPMLCRLLKSSSFWFGLFALSLLITPLHGQDADEQYIGIYRTIKQADDLADTGQPRQAQDLYLSAQKSLKQLQVGSPNWNPKVVQFRLQYIESKLSSLATRLPPPGIPTPTPLPGTATPTAPSASPEAIAALQAEHQKAVALLKVDIQRLSQEKTTLDARLREALAAQPAGIDPKELEKAEVRLRSLQKENDVLKVTLDGQKLKLDRLIDPVRFTELQQTLDETRRRVTEQQRTIDDLQRAATRPVVTATTPVEREQIDILRRENDILRKQLAAAGRQPDTTSLRRIEELERQLREARTTLSSQQTVNDSLKAQIRQGERDIESARKDLKRRETELAELERQRATLARQAAKPAPTLPAAPGGADPSLLQKMVRLESESARLQQELESTRVSTRQAQFALDDLKKDRAAVEQRLSKQVKAAEKQASLEAERAKRLEAERDELNRRLTAAARKSVTKETVPIPSVRNRDLSAEDVARLKARLQAYEAEKVPFSAEELALFREPQTPKALSRTVDPRAPTDSTKATSPGPKPLPAEAGTLIAEAQRDFSARRLDDAAKKYGQVLQMDDQNAATLANLAVIQMEQGHLDEAEGHLKKALLTKAADAHNWTLMGILRFRQKRYDEALDALSRSAAIDPNDAETQNYLGITLSEKGQRGPAETALRRALQLSPGYANAHHNLAIIYLSQKPPFIELARWHYQKALAAGHPRNEDLERMLDAAAAPAK